MSSTPQEVWDEWFKAEHGGTGVPKWELTDDSTELEDETE